jgi:hypothetical protein
MKPPAIPLNVRFYPIEFRQGWPALMARRVLGHSVMGVV